MIPYLRVSTEEQRDNGGGIDAQRDRIASAGRERGWQLLPEVNDAGLGGGSVENRPNLEAAMARCDSGEADGIVVVHLDRLSRSVVDFGHMLERAKRHRWKIVVLAMDLDMTTAVGELLANILIAVAQFERKIIAERTSAGMRAKQRTGVAVYGRGVDLPADTRQLIASMRADGVSLSRIAKHLNDEGVPTARGGAKWWPSTVAAVLRSVEHDATRRALWGGLRRADDAAA
jgi:DNA invertase Pin-like site-specific DNA recombinase